MKNTILYTSEAFLVEGGRPLRGKVRVSGSKNASLPILMASILTDQTCQIENVPDLLDTRTTLELLQNLGVEAEFKEGRVSLNAKYLRSYEAPDEMVRRMRASVLVMGPLLARFGKAVVSMPGGCSIGVRSIDQHLKVFERAGAHIEIKHGYIHLELKEIKPVEYTFEVITVTGTENALLFLSRLEKRSILRNIALEPEVMDLVEVLRKMGAEIEIEDRTAIIRGNPYLRGFSHRVIPDRIEAGTLMVAGFITGGDIVLEDIRVEHLGSVMDYYTKTVFEAVSTELDITVIAGGRYDYLVEEFGGPPTPAIGFAVGVERLSMLVKDLPLEEPLYVVVPFGDVMDYALMVAKSLRSEGKRVEVSYRKGGLKKQLEFAHKIGAQYAVIVGEEEKAGGFYTLKNMETGEQVRVELSPIF